MLPRHNWPPIPPTGPGTASSGCPPQRFGHGIEFAEVKTCAQRIPTIEDQPIAFGEQLVAQPGLQQVEGGKSFFHGRLRVPAVLLRPVLLDTADPFNHHLAVVTMRTAVEWQAKPDRGIFGRRQKETIGPEIVEGWCAQTNAIEHRAKAWPRQQLARQQVMTLKRGIVAGPALAVDRAEGKPGPRGSIAIGPGNLASAHPVQLPQTRMNLPLADGSS